VAVTQIDFEEQSSGYQAAYSKLSASEGAAFDPVSYAPDPRAYLVEGLNRLNAEIPGFQQQVLGRCDPAVCGPFLTEARAQGLKF
jgi:exportin-2 (importin alpha re-exporter)